MLILISKLDIKYIHSHFTWQDQRQGWKSGRGWGSMLSKVCMDFVRSYFFTNDPLSSWTLLSSKLDRGLLRGSFICKEVTSYKIHTLVFSPWIELTDLPKNLGCQCRPWHPQFRHSWFWSYYVNESKFRCTTV